MQGWDFVNDGAAQGRTKWGYVSMTVGSTLRFKVRAWQLDTTRLIKATAQHPNTDCMYV